VDRIFLSSDQTFDVVEKTIFDQVKFDLSTMSESS
jgi:hypothetical protein